MRPIESTIAWRSTAAPDRVWAALTDVGAYTAWWDWLERLDGGPAAVGTDLRATIRAPAGYRIRCIVRLTDVVRHRRLAAEVLGDLGGWADIAIEPDGGGTRVALRSHLYPRRALLRVLGALAEPVLVRGHDRIMDRGAGQFVAGSGVDLIPAPTAGARWLDRSDGRTAADVARAAVVAGVLSGVPSTGHALMTGGDPLEAARAAGALLGRPTLTRGVAAHSAVTLGWTAVLAALLPRRGAVIRGAAAGLVIAGLDLGIVGRRIPAIRALPAGPQLADHVAFGALVGASLARSDRAPPRA